MLSTGDRAPTFTLPAVADGEVTQIALEEYVGENVVVLAFYPSDFNPACSDGRTGLDDLDLFTMQKDVAILGISGDSVHSHRAFAAEYDLHIPLLADVRGDVAREYGVAVEDPDAGYLTERAVVVVGPDGEVEYTWRAGDPTELPPVDDVRTAVDNVGGGDTAASRYRVAHAHYVEGRRAFTSAMQAYDEMEWMLAQNDFTQAYEEFDEAAANFDTAARFAEHEDTRIYYERAQEKARALWQAAEWLAESANAYASGEGAEGEQLRRDAEGSLESARDIHDPPDPDDFPPEEDPDEFAVNGDSLPPSEGADSTSLGVDIDAELEESADADGDSATDDTGSGEGSDPAAGDTDGWGSPPTASAATTPDSDGTDADGEEDDSDESEEIDEAELEEITAELEEQTKAAQEREAAEDTGSVIPDSPGVAADRAAEAAGSDGDGSEDEDEDIALDLADPAEGESDAGGDDEDEEDEDEDVATDLGGGDHGVPDSL